MKLVEPPAAQPPRSTSTSSASSSCSSSSSLVAPSVDESASESAVVVEKFIVNNASLYIHRLVYGEPQCGKRLPKDYSSINPDRFNEKHKFCNGCF